MNDQLEIENAKTIVLYEEEWDRFLTYLEQPEEISVDMLDALEAYKLVFDE